MKAYRVWSPELGETVGDAQTIEAESPESAAIAAHLSITETSGAQIDGVYCVRALFGGQQWVSVQPIVTYSARPIAPRCDRCGGEATHDVHSGAERAVCDEHATRRPVDEQTPRRR